MKCHASPSAMPRSRLGCIVVTLGAVLVTADAHGQSGKPAIPVTITPFVPSVPLPLVATQIGKRPVDLVVAAVGNDAAGTANDLVVKSTDVDPSGRFHARVQQTLRGVPVWGGQAIAHLRPDGTLEEVTDELARNVAVSTTPKLTADQAAAAAEATLKCATKCTTGAPKVELVVYPSSVGHRLAYRVELRRGAAASPTAIPVSFVDAQTGAVLSAYDNVQTATGDTNYHGRVTFTTSRGSDGIHYLEDTANRHGVFDADPATGAFWMLGSPNDVWSNRSAVDVHYGVGKVLEYLRAVHGRRGLDGANGPWPVQRPEGTPVLAAFIGCTAGASWDGANLHYCTRQRPWTTPDIIAHEMGHAVIQYTSGLVYEGESGALNESFADVLGVLFLRHLRGDSPANWHVGEQMGEAIRYLDAPHRSTRSLSPSGDPCHYRERYTLAADNGGVHVNSGIGNFAFYLVAMGGRGHYSSAPVAGIGVEQAGKIWFRAFTAYMAPTTNYAGARLATLRAAAALHGYGSAQFNAVDAAWRAVGVEGSLPPAPSAAVRFGPSLDDAKSGLPVELVTNGDFSGTPAPWLYQGRASVAPGEADSAVHLCGERGSSGSISQDITIPANAASVSLGYSLAVVSRRDQGIDRLDVSVVDPRTGVVLDGRVLEMVVPSRTSPSNAGWAKRGPLDLTPYRGRTVRLKISCQTPEDGPLFRVDKVGVTARFP